MGADRLLAVGTASDKASPGHRFVTLGGAVMGKAKKAANIVIVFDVPETTPHDVAELMLGLSLRAYRFDKYKTKKKDDAEADVAPHGRHRGRRPSRRSGRPPGARVASPRACCSPGRW